MKALDLQPHVQLREHARSHRLTAVLEPCAVPVGDSMVFSKALSHPW